MSVPRLAVVALLSAAVLTACNDSETQALVDDVTALPGVVDARAEVEDVDEGQLELAVAVTVSNDATAEEVVAAIEVVGADDTPSEVNEGIDLVVRRPGADGHELTTYAPTDDAAGIVDRWLAVEDVLGDDTAWEVTTDGVVVEVAEDASAGDVAAVAGRVAGDASTAAIPGWEIRDEDSDDVTLSTDGPTTSDLVATWRDHAAAADLLTDATAEHLRLYASEDGSISLATDLEVSDLGADADLTPEAWGDRLWPALDVQLALLPDLPPGSAWRSPTPRSATTCSSGSRPSRSRSPTSSAGAGTPRPSPACPTPGPSLAG